MLVDEYRPLLSHYLSSPTEDDFYHKDFQYHTLRSDRTLWFMSNTFEVLYLNRGSEIEHRIRRNTTIRQCVLYYRLHYDAHTSA